MTAGICKASGSENQCLVEVRIYNALLRWREILRELAAIWPKHGAAASTGSCEEQGSTARFIDPTLADDRRGMKHKCL